MSTIINPKRRIIEKHEYEKFADSATWPDEARECLTHELADPYYEVDEELIKEAYLKFGDRMYDPVNTPEMLVGWYPEHYLTQAREHQHLLHLMSFRFHPMFDAWLNEQIADGILSGRPYFYVHKIDDDYIELMMICESAEDKPLIEMMWPSYFAENKPS